MLFEWLDWLRDGGSEHLEPQNLVTYKYFTVGDKWAATYERQRMSLSKP